MPLSKEKKVEVSEGYRHHERDTGSTEVQIAMLSERIRHLTEHFKVHKHDHHGRLGLLKLVGQRRRLLRYYRRNHPAQYGEFIKGLGIRK